MSSNRDYWRKRYVQIAAANQRRTIQYEQEMMAQVDVIYTEMSRQIADWYRRYARTARTTFPDAAKILKDVRTQGWEMTLDEFERKARLGGYDDELDLQYIRSQVARLQQLQVQLVESVAPVVPAIVDGMSDELKAQYQTTYEHAMYLSEAVTGVKGNFATYNEDTLKLVVAKPWYGANFSQRIWGEMQDKLPDVLMNELAQAVVLGTGPNELTRQLSQRYVKYKRSNIHRLIVSEMGHIDEQATLKSYEDCGADGYEYLATLEAHTCDECGALDGKHFSMTERKDGTNYPLLHAYCRCTTAIWEPDMPEPKQRWMRDPITGKGKRVPMQTFAEWKQEHSI